MTPATRRRSRTPVSEEAVAAARVVLGLSVGVGGMAAVMGAAVGEPIVVVGLPTIALIVAIVRGATSLAGWCAVAVWAILLPSAHGEAILAPLAMMALCLAIAVGPYRLLAWIGHDVAGRRTADAAGGEAWIEEDGHAVD
jgi:hypothetical protein